MKAKTSSLIILLIIVILVVGVKQGWFKFKGKGITIGDDDVERRIIRQQWEYIHTKCDSLSSFLPKGLDPYRVKYVIARFEDFYQQIIVYNHIKTDPEYIRLKQEMALALVLKRTENEYFRTEDFKKWFDNLNEEIIKRLVFIRETYKEK